MWRIEVEAGIPQAQRAKDPSIGDDWKRMPKQTVNCRTDNCDEANGKTLMYFYVLIPDNGAPNCVVGWPG